MFAIVKFAFTNDLRRVRRLCSLLNSVLGEQFSSRWDVLPVVLLDDSMVNPLTRAIDAPLNTSEIAFHEY